MPPVEPPSRQVLDETPTRVLTYLLGVAKYPVIATVLGTKGYDQAENDYAWGLLAMLGKISQASTPSAAQDATVQKAVAELDAWDEPNFEMIEATLSRKYPDLVPRLFTDLEPKQGVEAVGSVSTMLDRLDALDKDTSAKSKAAMKLLATRGYTKDERKRLRDLVNVAKTVTAAPPPVTDEERDRARLDLHAWYREWSTIAKRTITRRQHLIALGLATPRKAGKKKGGKAGKGEEEGKEEKKEPTKAGAEEAKKATPKAPEGEKKAPAPAKPADGAEGPAKPQ